MPVESADDLAAFFNPDEFGESIAYNGVGGFTAIWHRPVQSGHFVHGDIPSDRHLFEIPVLQPIAPVRGGIITIAATGETFTICEDVKRSQDGSAWMLVAA